MATELFQPRKFRAEALLTIEQMNSIIEEYQAQGFVMSLRQLNYQFIARNFHENTTKNYRLARRTLHDARRAGVTDWDAIEDRGRDLVTHASWDSPADIVSAAAQSYREDLWLDQGHRIEVWIEKDALTGVIGPVCDEYRVSYTSARGDTSTTEVYKAGKRMAEYLEDGLTPVVLHLADHDSKGVDMTRDLARRLSIYAREDIEVRRLALSIEQARYHDLPPNRVKELDVTTPAYMARFGTSDCWELDADSDDCGHAIQLNAATRSDRRRPPFPMKATGLHCRHGDLGQGFLAASRVEVWAVIFRMLSPLRTRRCALWTRRSRTASAMVGSAMTSCQ